MFEVHGLRFRGRVIIRVWVIIIVSWLGRDTIRVRIRSGLGLGVGVGVGLGSGLAFFTSASCTLLPLSLPVRRDCNVRALPDHRSEGESAGGVGGDDGRFRAAAGYALNEN